VLSRCCALARAAVGLGLRGLARLRCSGGIPLAGFVKTALQEFLFAQEYGLLVFSIHSEPTSFVAVKQERETGPVSGSNVPRHLFLTVSRWVRAGAFWWSDYFTGKAGVPTISGFLIGAL